MSLSHSLRASTGASSGNDPYFKYNSLLLLGNGTDGEQNQTVLDESTNAHAITRYGNATQGSFSPFSRPEGYWSNYFDGNGDYLYLNSSSLVLNGTYTLEFWLYLNDYGDVAGGNGCGVIFNGTTNSDYQRMMYSVNPDGSFYLSAIASGTTPFAFGTAPSKIKLNTWHHVAVVTDGITLTVYIDGVNSASGAVSYAGLSLPNTFYIGFYRSGGAVRYMNGFVSNFRLVKNTQVYTSNFTPPTAPLTAIANTTLLTCQSNRFLDNSVNAFAITPNGNVAVKPFSPLSNPSFFYDAPDPFTDGYFSNSFDGNGDYLRIPDNAAFQFGSGDMTVEAWIYPTSQQPIYGGAIASYGSPTTYNGWHLAITGSNESPIDRIAFSYNYSNGGYSTSAIPRNQWTHIAVTKSGTTLRFFVNGVLDATTTLNVSVITGAGAYAYVGTQGYDPGSSNRTFIGNISNVRVLKGTAQYSSSFTVPNTPLTSIANTSLLTCQSSELVDRSSNNFAITKYGDVTVQSFHPFVTDGYWSNYFEKDSGYLLTDASSTQFDFGTGDFTVEGWVYPIATSTSASEYFIPFVGTYGSFSTSTEVNWSIYYYAPTSVFAIARRAGGVDSGVASSTVAISYNKWQHWACVRSAGVVTFYVNGVSVGGGTWTQNLNITQRLCVNARFGGFTPFSVIWRSQSYFSNIRVLKGTALYTSAFTPSSTPLTAIANTSFLTCQSNKFKDNSPNNFAITPYGGYSVKSFVPFSITPGSLSASKIGSLYLDGTGDYLTIPNNPVFDFGTNDFTIEAWIYPTATGGKIIVDARSADALESYVFSTTSSDKLDLIYSTNRLTSSASIPINTWTHVAVSRASGVIRLFINGTVDGSVTFSSAITSRQAIAIGGGRSTASSSVTGYFFNGYMSSLRILNSLALYTSTFTPPSAPLSPTNQTSLLLNFTNIGVVDSTGTVNVETVGNTRILTSQKKYGTGSMYFDGNGDYLAVPAHNIFDFGTGDFTVEFWFYITSGAGTFRNFGRANIFTAIQGVTTSVAMSLQGSTMGASGYNAGVGSTAISYTTAIPQGQWHHFAMSRSSGIVRTFLNGAVATVNASTDSVTNNFISIGGFLATDSYYNDYFNGFIDDFRVTKGIGRYTGNFTPPNQYDYTDPYAGSVVLALSGEAQNNNGAQNNSFADSSTNQFPVTRYGNTTQGTFSPFGYNWSVYANTSSRLSAASNSAFNIDTYSSIECFVNLSSLDTNSLICGREANFWLAYSFSGIGGSANKFVFSIYNGSSWQSVSSTTTPTVGTWYHIVGIKDNTTLRIYVNGVQEATATFSGSPSNSAYSFWMPSYTASESMTGYLSNVRLVSGTTSGALPYTGNFAVPTAPLTAINNTKFLSCQSNRFKDNSSNDFALTVAGSPSVTNFAPFPTNTEYSTGTNGGSGYFDGSGDYLSASSNAAFSFGTGNFTIECFFYPTSSDSTQTLYLLDSTGGITFSFETISSVASFLIGRRGTAVDLSATYSIVPFQWLHLVAVRSGTTASLYINGTRVATGTNSLNYTVNGPVNVGAIATAGGFEANGYISNLRVVKGTAVYDPTQTTLTVPTSPLASITNTSLLLNFVNGSIVDATGKNNLETVGNAQISTSVKKYGTGSLKFDGTDDALKFPISPNVQLGSGDWTIEAWVNITAHKDYNFIYSYGPPVEFYTRAGGYLALFLNDSDDLTSPIVNMQTTATISTGQWTHVAAVRNGSNFTLYIDGVSSATATSTSSIFSSATQPSVGNYGSTAGSQYAMNGYIDDLRITRRAKYTGNFTPPAQYTSADPYYKNVVLHLSADAIAGVGYGGSQNNSFADDSSNQFPITRYGNTTQGSFSPFGYNWSNYFDGSGDYLSISDNASLRMGTSDFTIEFWVYFTSISGYQTPFTKGYNATGSLTFQTGNGDGKIVIYTGSTGTALITASTAATVNTWNHYALVRSGTTLTLYLNGSSVGTATNSTDFNNTGDLGIGSNLASIFYPITGYISNLRILKGTAQYSSAFTPATAPLTAITNTSLLTCQSNRFIDNSSNAFTITPYGNAAVTNFAPFPTNTEYSTGTNGGSGYFDGSGDYLSLGSNVLPDISGVFTYECWFYPLSGTASHLFGTWNNNTGGWGLFASNTTASFQGMSIWWYFGNYGSGECARGINSNVLNLNSWNHIAVVRNSSNVWAFYVNGVERTTITYSTGTATWSDSRSFTDNTNTAGIGTSNYPPIQSYLSSCRLVNGSAVYTSNFTPSTTPLTAIANTSLLLNFTNGAIVDSLGRVTLETAGDAKTGVVKKYGSTSLYFDGTGDYLYCPTYPLINFGTNDFTIELWANFSTTGSYLGLIGTPTNLTTAGAGQFYFYKTNADKIAFGDHGIGNIVITNTSVTSNTWIHIAVVRYNNTFMLFLNGALDVRGTSTVNLNSPGSLLIGAIGTPYYMNGYLDDIRITRYAKYRGGFTTPIRQLPAR